MKGSNVSLKEFHVVFITASVLLTMGFATWGFAQYQERHGGIYVGAFLLSLVAAVGLVCYEVYFVKKVKSYRDR